MTPWYMYLTSRGMERHPHAVAGAAAAAEDRKARRVAMRTDEARRECKPDRCAGAARTMAHMQNEARR